MSRKVHILLINAGIRYDTIIEVIWGRCSLFGYIKVDRANLLGKEYDAYKGIYCALCKQLGKDYSLLARFILSYDCTFYAMLALSLSDECPSYCGGRCRFDPLKKCAYARTNTAALSMAAALSVSSSYYKLRDNLLDSPWYKRIGYRLIQPVFARWRRKAQKKYPAIDRAVGTMLEEQIAAERSLDVTVDRAADPTAKMLATVCGMIPDYVPLSSGDPQKNKRILSSFGYFLGRWIYLIDAADDYGKDRRRGNFNPLNGVVQDERALPDAVIPMLNHALSEALLSYGLLDAGRFDAIILNVLKISCVKIQNTIVSQYTNQKNGENHEESL